MGFWPFHNRGLVNTSGGRDGIIIAYMRSADSYNIVTNLEYTYNIILEIKEVYNDKFFSKVEVVNIPYNSSDYSIMNIFNPWVDGKKIHWLQPDRIFDRDKKLEDILK